MSALTKLFVVLLIVCSLLLTAAVVVFVNRTEDHREIAATATRNRDAAVKERADVKAQLDASAINHGKMVTVLNAELGTVRAELAKVNADLAAEQSNVAQHLAEKRSQAAALAIAQATVQSLSESIRAANERFAALKDEAEKLRIVNAQTVGANTDLQEQIHAAERERRWLSEQLTQAKTELERVRAQAEFPAGGGARAMAARDIKGVIREVRFSNGQYYATISVGAADRVERGMTFNVIDEETKEFLAKLTVDTVEANEAVGRMEGPRVANVRENHQVVTQL